ncbi:MAG: hypothetical protein LBL13_12570 [Bacteroidales bacterium]|jgi:hypothetical protein|nr:hypothetical protein [Bacteroidales bacterium]
MKKIFFILCTTLIFQSCTNEDRRLKKEIVGEYSYSTITEDEEDDISTVISINGTCTFNSDGSCEDIATLAVTYIDEEGEQTNIKYRCEVFGKYDIQKSHIIYDYNLENIKIILLKTDDYDISDFFSEYFIPQLKHEILANNREKILELTDKLLKTETEIDGEKETVIYIRQSK